MIGDPMSEQTIRTPSESEVLAFTDEIVSAFAATDTDRYFAAFAPEASFDFHPEPRRFNVRAEYETEWAGWLESGWRVVSCETSDALVHVFPGGAVISHTVDTTVDTDGETESYTERETIVYRVDGDGLIGIHEHLSAVTTE